MYNSSFYIHLHIISRMKGTNIGEFEELVLLTNFPYHTPVQIAELFVGLLAVLLIAIIMIGSQTMKAARSNPAEVLKSE